MTMSPVHFSTLASVPSWGGYELGLTENGCPLNIQVKWDDVMSDDMGGLKGVPSDRQFLGAQGFLDLTFTKYVKDRMDNMASHNAAALVAGTKGLMPPIGTFARQGGMGAPLILTAPNEVLSFEFAMLVSNYEFNSGTPYRKYRCLFEVWLNQTDYAQLTSAQSRRLFTMTSP